MLLNGVINITQRVLLFTTIENLQEQKYMCVML
jgi:hypothetical protein